MRTLPQPTFYSWEVATHEMASISDQKKELRRRFRFERSQRSLGGDWLHLVNAIEFKRSAVIASYISYGDEPDTKRLNQAISDSGRQLILPRTDENGIISWIIWGKDSRIEPAARRGLFKPKLSQPIGEEFSGAIDLVILPALRVDRSGVRLGQGGGSYDRALCEVSTSNAWKVALLHDEELTSEPLPKEDHDVLVDAVALPEIVVRFKRS